MEGQTWDTAIQLPDVNYVYISVHKQMSDETIDARADVPVLGGLFAKDPLRHP